MRYSKKRYVGIIALVIVLGFIFVNSMMNGVISQSISALPKKFVQLFIPYGKYKWLDDFLIHRIRKFTHCAEFCVLELLICYLYSAKNNKQKLLNTFYISLSVAILDETIQIFSHRQSNISDIWRDMFGVLIGCLLYLLLYKINNHRKVKTNDKN